MKKKTKKKTKKKSVKKIQKEREYKVKTKEGEVKVEIPSDMDKATKDLILATLKESLSKEYEEQAMTEIERMRAGVETLMIHLKKDGLYSKEFEKDVRKMIGIYLNRGVQLGKRYEGRPDELMEIIQMRHPNIKEKLAKLPPEKRFLAEYIMHSFILGKQCYEAGMSLSALMSIDKKQKYKKQLEKATDTYIW